jgi:hypothetical protein
MKLLFKCKEITIILMVVLFLQDFVNSCFHSETHFILCNAEQIHIFM